MAPILYINDLPTAARTALGTSAETVVNGLNAKVLRVAPCLGWDGQTEGFPVPTEGQLAEAKLILLGVVTRWAEAGSGAVKTAQSGSHAVTFDTQQRSGYNLWPSEIEGLQDICKAQGASVGRLAFSIDTAPRRTLSGHTLWCNLLMGDTYCSCGASIAGFPLFEGESQ